MLRIDGALMSEAKPRLVGLNHIALEVGDVDEALSFYGQIFSFELRGRSKGQAFIDMGDQFIALMETSSPHSDQHPSRKRRDGRIVLGEERVDLPFWIRREFGLCQHR